MARTRRSSIAGFVLAAAGLTILGSHGPVAGAQIATTQAKAPVAGVLGFVTPPAASVELLNGTSPGAPGDVVTAGVSMKVESNKGYVVSVQAKSATMTADGTDDVINIGAMTTTTPSDPAAISSTAPVTIASKATKSVQGGDDVSSTLSLTIPWVEPGTYSVNLDYTVAQS